MADELEESVAKLCISGPDFLKLKDELTALIAPLETAGLAAYCFDKRLSDTAFPDRVKQKGFSAPRNLPYLSFLARSIL